MNYTNFERKYVSNGIAGSIDTICLWKHKNGSVCEIEQYMNLKPPLELSMKRMLFNGLMGLLTYVWVKSYLLLKG
ncbi:hypothetical protein G2285_00209 [Escherichia phage vB_EcoM_G2285]|nr:hypothetical protein G2285_00209 [Escherichia phage vB_EcoM_G2285]